MSVAERKYDLALVQTLTEKKVRHQPWYKERLREKFIKSLEKSGSASQLISGKNWIFLKDGLDDFRDGLPPVVEGSEFIKSDRGAGPNITGESGVKKKVKEPAAPCRFTKQQICFSRTTPLQQQRREHIDEIEYGLLQHPLALYPHLEESVQPEIFEHIVNVLDPEMNMVEEGDLYEEENGKEEFAMSPPGSASSTKSEGENQEKDLESDDTETVRNPYRWLPRKDEKEGDKKDRHRIGDKTAGFLSQEEHIKQVTHEFCQWVADLGGETNNIEESTITSLFASGYETKPALSVPIHVVELTNVPPELRMSPTAAPQLQATNAGPKTEISPRAWTASGDYQPSWMKFKYGAWYLPANTWKKRDWGDPLLDPRQKKDNDMSASKRRSQTLNQELSVMHASKAFMEFINRKGVRKPEFLEEVAEIQRLTELEEQKRLEAELLAKQRKIIDSMKNTSKS